MYLILIYIFRSFQDRKAFIGTTRYASKGAHQGHEQSRKDDLESLGYMLIYLHKACLPWSNIPSKNNVEKIQLVGNLK